MLNRGDVDKMRNHHQRERDVSVIEECKSTNTLGDQYPTTSNLPESSFCLSRTPTRSPFSFFRTKRQVAVPSPKGFWMSPTTAISTVVGDESISTTRSFKPPVKA